VARASNASGNGTTTDHAQSIRFMIVLVYCSGISQPPTRWEEHRPVGDVHVNVNVCLVCASDERPRSTHDSSHPRTQRMLVSPTGASTTSSKVGSDGCARPATQPRQTKAATATRRRLVRIIETSSSGGKHERPMRADAGAEAVADGVGQRARRQGRVAAREDARDGRLR
jgi:hypothetical protein